MKNKVVDIMNEPTLNLNFQIGEAAGIVYKELEKGERNLTQLKKHLVENGFDPQTYIMSIGWLAREDKLDISRVGKKWSIRLK